MKRLRHAAVCLVLAAVGCAPVDDSDVPAEVAVGTTQQKLAVDNLYAKLRELEGVLPRPPATGTIAMGSWAPGGSFSGVGTTCNIVYYPVKHRQCTPPSRAVYAINLFMSFDVPDGVTLTANGKTATSSGGRVVLDVGNADVVDWTLRSGSYSYTDKLMVNRPEVGGVGAFTVALPRVRVIPIDRFDPWTLLS